GRLARAPDQLQDVSEDELALAAGIRGADDLVGAAEEPPDHRELLARGALLDGLEPELLGYERERRQRPLLQRRVVVLRLLESHEMPQGPGHLVTPALDVAVMARGGAKERSQLSRDGRLLGEHDDHDAPASAGRPDSIGCADRSARTRPTPDG